MRNTKELEHQKRADELSVHIDSGNLPRISLPSLRSECETNFQKVIDIGGEVLPHLVEILETEQVTDRDMDMHNLQISSVYNRQVDCLLSSQAERENAEACMKQIKQMKSLIIEAVNSDRLLEHLQDAAETKFESGALNPAAAKRLERKLLDSYEQHPAFYAIHKLFVATDLFLQLRRVNSAGEPQQLMSTQPGDNPILEQIHNGIALDSIKLLRVAIENYAEVYKNPRVMQDLGV